MGNEGEEVEAGLLLAEPEPMVGVDEAGQEEGEGREEGEGADAEVVEEGEGGLSGLLVVEQVVLVEPGHLEEVLGEDLHVLEVEMGRVAPLRLLQLLDHLAGSVEHVLEELVGVQPCCLGGQLPGGGLLDVLVESFAGEAGRVGGEVVEVVGAEAVGVVLDVVGGRQVGLELGYLPR